MVNLNTKQTAQKIAKRIAQEQLEVLKSARAQISPETSQQTQQVESNQPSLQQEQTEQMKQKIAQESSQKLQALEAEIKKIREAREQAYQQRLQSSFAKATEGQARSEVPRVQSKRRRGMLGAVKKKLSDMSGRTEKQRNVSG